MVSLILLVFLIQLFIYIVNTIGAKTINDLLWQLSSRLPLAASKQAQEQIRLRREVVHLKREMNSISAQDDFARWAKVRRTHDKILAEHDKIAERLTSSRASFDTKASAVRWTMTTGLKTGLQFWHSKTPIFPVPVGWFPWYVERMLAFPRAPVGGVSIGVWSTVCGSVIALVGGSVIEVVGSMLGLKQDAATQAGAPGRVPVMAPAQGSKAA